MAYVTNERGAVELRGVTKRFGSAVAVDALDLHVRAGEFLSLLGPSGCGKTTTLRMLAGFEHPDAGVILLSGVDIAGTPPYRRDVNTVFQHYALFPHMTVAENVAFGLVQKKVARDETRRRVAEALAMVDMAAFASRRPKQLSGGQQQRVALARALVNRPSLLLLDEPLGALDRKLRQEMQIELKLLQTQLGITFVYVTHDQEEALSMSDRIAVMVAGRVRQLGTPDDVYDRPASAFVAGFIGQQNFLAGTARGDGLTVDGDGFTAAGARRADDVVIGARALAAVRPEHVMVSADDPRRDVNAVRGTVAGVANLGEVMQLVVRAHGGHDVVSRRPRHLAPPLSMGADVWCTWSPEHVHVFGDAHEPSARSTNARGSTS